MAHSQDRRPGGRQPGAKPDAVFDGVFGGPIRRVLHGRGGTGAELSFRLCRPDELSGMLALQDIVQSSIAAKDTFVATTREEFAESLVHDFCIGAFSPSGHLAALTLMVSNRPGSRNLAHWLDGGPERYGGCVTYDTTFVDPRFRGLGLQRYFIGLKDDLALALGARRACATVSPDNGVSLSNLRSGGFQIVGEQNMYGGFCRYILCKTLAADAAGRA